jgi:hypothetical protein
LDFGVEVKKGNLLGRGSGDTEPSFEARMFGGERFPSLREAACGGGIAV